MLLGIHSLDPLLSLKGERERERHIYIYTYIHIYIYVYTGDIGIIYGHGKEHGNYFVM